VSNPIPVAVILLNYFGCDDTEACVESLSSDARFHVFVVDNSADPGERDRIKTVLRPLSRIDIIEAETNLGFAKGVNVGLKKAQRLGFTRFLILNNDTVLSPDAGSVLEAAYERFPASLITPTIRWAGRLNRGNYYHPFLGLIRTAERPKPGPPWLYYLTGCALAFDDAFLERVGYLDERFFMYGEDVEYSQRAVRLGLNLVTLGDVIVAHAGSRSSNLASLFYEYHINRSHLLLCFLLFQNPSSRLLALCVKLPVLAGRALYRTVAHRSLNPLSAFLMSPFDASIRPAEKRPQANIGS
jgi:N-acetylglucosaminyl-diphospho-decaprenol L-rhamnosyltransferase